MIKVESIEKSYGELNVLKGLNFSLEAGESVALLGANGAGKTTALRILCGLIKRDAGIVEIDGFDPEVDPINARYSMGVVGDREGLYERLNVREYLAYFGGLHNMSRQVLETETERVIQLLNMSHLIDRRTAGFSQGERMKVSLARALLHNPKVLILDEPTRGLDVPSVRLLRRVLGEYRANGGSLLFSSHVMQEVEVLSDRVIIMARGKIVANGTSDELIQQAEVSNLEDAFVTLSQMEDVV